MKNRRRDPRKPTPTSTARLYTPGDPAHLLGVAVAMVDLSLHGAGFRTEAPLVAGATYGLEIRGNGMNLSSRVKVAVCRRNRAGDYLVGVEFC